LIEKELLLAAPHINAGQHGAELTRLATERSLKVNEALNRANT